MEGARGLRAMTIALWGVTMVLLVACATAAPPASREFEDRGRLSVGRERRGEQLVLDSRRGASYRITGLRPGAAYEARLSYPATNPAVFKVMFAADHEREDPFAEDGPKRGGSSRSLLNVVQQRFVAPVTVVQPGSATVPVPESEDGTGFRMLVSAAREGVLAPDAKEDNTVHFNILVEELVLHRELFGGVPGGALGVAALSVGLLGLAAYGATKLRRLLLLRAPNKRQ